MAETRSRGSIQTSLRKMSACEGCSVNYFSAFRIFFEDPEKSLAFLREHGVLPSAVQCPNCNRECTYREEQRLWRCTGSSRVPKKKKRRYCDFSISDSKGTFFQGVNLPLWKVVVFVNHWLSPHWDHHTVIHCLGISSKISVDWRSFCSEVTEFWFQHQEAIGGPDTVVEIDETLIVRRKYGRGRVLCQVWLFGGIERGTKRRFVVPLIGPLGEAGRRDKRTLLPLIEQYIRRGTVIISDQWRAYNTLSQLGYTHFTINHSQNFVDPVHGEIHTQNIERLWRDVKESVKRPGIRSKFLYQYLARYLFLKDQDEDALLHQFFVQAAKLYPPQSNKRRELEPVPGASDQESDDE